MRAILAEPPLHGPEVWNKQRKDEVLLDVEDVALGHDTKMRWNDTVRVGLVTRADPRSARDPRAVRRRAGHVRRTNQRRARTPTGAGRHYVLAGLLRCGVCGRRMQGQWNHGRAYYRCKYPERLPRRRRRPPQERLREGSRRRTRSRRLARRRCSTTSTSTTPARCSQASPSPTPTPNNAKPTLREAIKECDRKIERYRKLLDQDGDVAIAAKWITEVHRERRALEAQLGYQIPGGKMTKDQVKALVAALRDIVDVLTDAEPADKAELYEELGVTLTYNPGGTVAVKAHPVWGKRTCRRGDTNPKYTRPLAGLVDRCVTIVRCRTPGYSQPAPRTSLTRERPCSCTSE